MTTNPPESARSEVDAEPRRGRRPVVLLVLELLLLAIPFNAAYGFVMRNVYGVDSLSGLLLAIAAVFVFYNAYVLWARFVARRDPAEFAPARVRGFGFGLALGAALICAALAVIAAAGDLTLSAGSGPALAGLPGVALLAGAAEEIIARGVVLRNLENVFGSVVALVLTAVLFGWLHAGNPHATVLSTIAIGVEGGAMLSAVYIATRSLWWVMGVHTAWNFTQTSVFSIADSGHPGRGFLASKIAGPDWLTGGVFGIESSLVSVVVCVAVAVFFLVRAHRDRRFVPPIWSSHR